jgi:Uma2 family endonuclease
MNVAAATPDALERQRPIRVDEYHRMIEAGILGEDERVELIDGVLVAMTPQGRLHAFVIQELNRLLVRALADEYKLLTQLPLTLGSGSEPEPDLAVVRAEDARSRTRHPAAALLVIEVAGDSLRLDRETKAGLYARAGVPEYWIVNLAAAAIEVYRDPDPATGSFRTMSQCRRDETLTALSVPGIRVDLRTLFD